MRRRRWGRAQPIALLLLLLAPLAGCLRPPSGIRAEDGGEPLAPEEPAEIPGFRSDAWYLPDDELLGFVEIPAGELSMGSDTARDGLAYDNERWNVEQPQGTVDLPAFFIGRYEVTVAQLRAFVEATQHSIDPQALQAPPDHPAVHVSWPDALAYCRWLESALGSWPSTPPALRQALRGGWRVGLPSEAQWERAARGGDARIYPWGDAPRRDRANYRATSTMPVGSFECPECPFGLSDMSGNVWELTRSRYQPYPYDESDDRGDLESEALWVMRGGHFGDPERNVRASVRGGVDPGARRPFIGFRVAISRY